MLLSPVAEKPSYATEIQLWLEHRATPAKLLSELHSPVICLENNSSPKLNCDCLLQDVALKDETHEPTVSARSVDRQADPTFVKGVE